MAVALEEFVKSLEDSGIITSSSVQAAQAKLPPEKRQDAQELARELVRQNTLTKYQAQEVYLGRATSLVLGNYTILDKIGQGGMGQVYKASHRRMERIVAIKILPPSVNQNPSTVARFEREIKAAARLSHPNIVAAFDADRANGVSFLVMEFVDGGDLSALVKKQGPLSVERAVSYVLQAAKGLDFAHREGVIHRDIKPANLLLDSKGTVKIMDMGLARFESSSPSGVATEAELTSSGAIMGTVDYMAPEQALDTRTADGRADVYSLGCTLYYLLTGRPVYDGATLMGRLLAHRETPIPSLADSRDDVPDELEGIFRKLLAKAIDDRYQSMSEVVADLERCGTDHQSSDTEHQPIGTGRQGESGVRRSFESVRPSFEPGPEGGMPTLLSEFPSLTLRETKPRTRRELTALVRGNKKLALLATGAAAALVAVVVGLVAIYRPGARNGTLRLDVGPPDADVWVVDELGKTEIKRKTTSEPLSLSVAPGKHSLRIRKPGFKPVDKRIVIAPEKTLRIKDALKLDVDREMAQWVLIKGGTVDLVGGPSGIRDDLKLPPDAFEIEGLQIWFAVKGGELRGLEKVRTLKQIALFADVSDEVLLDLAQSRNLTSLSLGRATQITDEGLRALAGLSHLAYLDISGARRITDAGLRPLRNLRELRRLGLASCSRITGEFLEGIESIPLTWMTIPGTAIIGPELLKLQRIKTLAVLDVRGGCLTDVDLEYLSKLDNVTSLYLGPEAITDEGLKRLSAKQSLGQLHFGHTPISGHGLAYLESTKPGALSVVHTLLDDRGLESLSALGTLTSLSLAGQGVTDDGLRHLGALPVLNSLVLDTVPIGDAGLVQLGKCRHLSSLALNRTDATAAGVALIRKSLPKCTVAWDEQRCPTRPETAANHAAHRAVAAWALKSGGRVTIAEAGQPREIEAAAQLPDQPFEVVSLALPEEQAASEELKLLKTFDGTWLAQEVIAPCDKLPDGSNTAAAATTEWFLAGRFQRTKPARPGIDPERVRVVTFDAKHKAFRSWLCMADGTVDEATGRWDEGSKEFLWTNVDRQSHAKCTCRIIDADNVEWKNIVKNPAGEVVTEGIVTMKRIR